MPVLENDQIFDRYRIIRWLGNGGAGESYEAEDRSLLRKVTLKLIHPWSTLSDAARRQFFREMQGISALTHPYLASILDYGEIDGKLYVARRFVSSGSLLGPDGRLWFRPPLAVPDAFTYAHQLAQVLQYIHQHGYLHGSLTFANVLVLRGPNAEHDEDYAPLLVADIGLANFVRRFGQPQVKTLPVSAAPEQLGRRARPASDQFALAVLLYFWLAGRPPYLGTPDEVEKLKLTETITPLSILNPGVTPEQDSLILRALGAYPENRHLSALAFTEALQASLAADAQTPRAAFNSFPELEPTPRANLQPVPRESQQITPLPERPDQSEEARADLAASTSPILPDEHLTPTAPPPEAAPEPLPSIPTTEPIARSPLAEISQIVPPQPTIPETPRVEEHALQAALAHPGEEGQTSPEQPAPDTQPSVNDEQIEQIDMGLVEQTETRTSAGPLSQVRPITTELPETKVEHKQSIQDLVSANERATTLPSTEQATVQISEPGVATPESQTVSEEQTAPDGSSSATNLNGIAPCLLIASPYDDHIYEFTLTAQEINIGRARASDLRLELDNLTSRNHAQIKREGERIFILDKHSSNGVYINGQRIQCARAYELADGDHIGIGNYELIFRSALGKALSRTSLH